jgi:polyisoprenoid-binding protein YceI
MKKILSLLVLFAAFYGIATAQIYKSKDKGVVISFFSTTPVENIDATNTSCSSLLNTATDSVLFKVPNAAFVFPKSLMQEHFNENYMETPKYPNSTFRGKINEKIDYTKDGTYKVTCTGKLLMHGVEQLRTIDGTLTVKGEEVTIVTEFNVKLADHKIEVPKVVFEKIAESILVKVNAQYAPYKKK